MANIELKTESGIDFLQIMPEGVCSKLMQLKIKNDIIIDVEFIGGCSGNLGGIKSLILGLNVNEVAQKLMNILCGSKGTSCPDQLAKGLYSYITSKQAVHS
ncbi:MAG: TIGR03905 family TSCPD domain-containing protein [bacterium]|nr:TIGR03905 family TSCPD domain-containing protein [bacterium]